MPDLLGKAAAWLAGQRHAHLTASVVYARGTDSVTLAATVGRTEFEAEDEYGRVVRTVSRDYLVRAQDLVIGGETVLPEPGDRITDGDAVFEVMSPTGEPEWRWSDTIRKTLRIHTKEV